MDRKVFFSSLVNLVLIFGAAITFYIMIVDLENQVEELTQTINSQDIEILELHGKNAELKEEIKSLEIFDCTFGKFPELRDHYYNKAVEDTLNGSK